MIRHPIIRMSIAVAIAAAAVGPAFASAAAPAATMQKLPRKAALGVLLAPPPQGKSGALVRDVVPGLTGETMGVRQGDLLLGVNGQQATSVGGVVNLASRLTAGDRVELELDRGGQRVRLSGRAVARPLESYAGAKVDYGAVPFRGGLIRDILVTPAGVSQPPVVFLLQGFSCVSIEPPSPAHPYRRLGEELLRSGIAYYRVEKPGLGDSAGGPKCQDIDYATELDAFRSAYRHLVKSRGVDPDRIFMFGHSLGALEAPMLAAETPPRGVAIYGAVYRNWADYHHDVFAFQSFLMAGEDPVQLQERSETLRDLLRRYYFDRQSPAQIAKEVPALASAMRETMEWDGGDQTMGRNYKYMQDLAHQPIPAAWRDTRSNVLSIYGESDLVALFDEDHKLIADVVNHYRPGTARYVEIPKTDHGMTLVGDRPEFRRRTISEGRPPNGEFNAEVSHVLADWVHASMKQPPVRTLPATPSARTQK